jgi:hypothetical protein
MSKNMGLRRGAPARLPYGGYGETGGRPEFFTYARQWRWKKSVCSRVGWVGVGRAPKSAFHLPIPHIFVGVGKN